MGECMREKREIAVAAAQFDHGSADIHQREYCQRLRDQRRTPGHWCVFVLLSLFRKHPKTRSRPRVAHGEKARPPQTFGTETTWVQLRPAQRWRPFTPKGTAPERSGARSNRVIVRPAGILHQWLAAEFVLWPLSGEHTAQYDHD